MIKTKEIQIYDASSISSSLQDVWITDFWILIEIFVHGANLCMIFHA